MYSQTNEGGTLIRKIFTRVGERLAVGLGVVIGTLYALCFIAIPIVIVLGCFKLCLMMFGG